jgi:hypothetical protein
MWKRVENEKCHNYRTYPFISLSWRPGALSRRNPNEVEPGLLGQGADQLQIVMRLQAVCILHISKYLQNTKKIDKEEMA